VVSADQFHLISGAESLTTYTFNTRTAKHLFCSVCGIKAFYVPRSHPDGFSVNVRSIDSNTIKHMTTREFNGREWEQQIPSRAGYVTR